MRILTSILALIGVIWAFTCLAGWYVMIESFGHVESNGDLARTIIGIILLLSGYFVWWGWIYYSYKERFPLLKPRAFWTLSLIHHSASALYLIPIDVWGGGDDPWWVPTWIIGNAILACVLILQSSFWHAPKKQEIASNDQAE
jgi:hypothetical protein